MRALNPEQHKIATSHNAAGTIIYNNKWLQLKDNNGYIYSHEIRCNGCIVVVLPFHKVGDNQWAFLVRDETTPCWGVGPTRSAITGGCESLDPSEDAARELKEEAGFSVLREQLILLGKCRASKSSDTYYYLYAVDVTDMTQEEALGDGSNNDQAPCVWITGDELLNLEDAQAITAYAKASVTLGIF